MITHTLRLVVRAFMRSKTNFVINLAGLSCAFTTALLIFLWVNDELAVDKFHAKDDGLYQLVSNVTSNGITSMREPTPVGLAHVLTTELPDIEFASTVTPQRWFPKVIAQSTGIKFKCEGKFVGRDFLKMFSYPLQLGSAETALDSKHSILISTDVAAKMFGSPGAAMGKVLRWELTDIKREGTVTGVFEVPANSTDQFDIVFPIEMLRDIMGFAEDDMQAFGPHTFITVPENANLNSLTEKIDRLVKSKRPDLKADSFYVVRYSSRYLYGNFENGIQQAGRMTYVRTFSLVAVAVLILACINFINLSTAESISRVKEVGVRKAIGASRFSLGFRSIAEAIALCMLSLTLSLTVVYAMLPLVNQTLDKQIDFPLDIATLAIFVAVTLAIGILAGAYPALHLARIHPLDALTKNVSSHRSRSFAREALVVFQFSLSVIAILIAIVTHSQISFMQQKSLGFEKQNVIYFENEGGIAKDPNAFITSLKEIPGVINASSMIGNFTGLTGPAQVLDINGTQIPLRLMFVNYDLIETMGIPMASGRTFQRDLHDNDKIIVNEKALAALGLADAIGKTITLGDRPVEIIGVVKDFHLASLHQQIEPVVFQLETDRHWNMVVRLAAGNQPTTLSRIEEYVQSLNPGLAFEYRFLQDEIDRQYKAEQRVGLLSLTFTVVAIFISMLGLLSLSSFICRRRIKEIGIRKVIGATQREILIMLSTFFGKVFLIALIVSMPLGVLIASNWLSNFAYSIQLQLWMFLATVIAAAFLIVTSVSVFLIRAANTNPASILKTV